MRRWLLAAAVLLNAATAAPSAATAASARTPEDFAAIRREMRIGADVLRAALANALPESRRVVKVEAGYLAEQGVLVIVDLASPWFRFDPRSIDIDSEFTHLEHMPDMVQDILGELNLGLSRHQVADLKELREIRDAQRGVRAEQRALRRELRELRRQLQRAGSAAEADALHTRIETLETELAAAEDEERTLDQDAVVVRDTLDAPSPRAGDAAAAPARLDLAVAESVCSYGATFRSLSAGQHLNVLVRQAQVSRYYVFEMKQVRACRDGGLTPEEMLEAGFGYEF
jgi:Spy/CpxP family protein refolding chaperone